MLSYLCLDAANCFMLVFVEAKEHGSFWSSIAFFTFCQAADDGSFLFDYLFFPPKVTSRTLSCCGGFGLYFLYPKGISSEAGILDVACSPSPSFYKFNVDGPSLGNLCPLGGGYIIRDALGSFVTTKAIFLGHHRASFYAELHAFLFGLEACLHLNLSCVHVETDSRLLFDLVVGGQAAMPWAYLSVF